MNDHTVSSSRPSMRDLRADLTAVPVSSSRSGMWMVVDAIAGRITRVSNELWQSLQQGDATALQWQQARSAGWTRQRRQTQRTPFSPLAVRIPLGSLDAIANRLAPWTGWVFGRLAVWGWCLAITAALLMVIGRSSQVAASASSLGAFLSQTHPLVLAFWFVVTKAVHELAHAIMCRRIGYQAGECGVLMLCGMPCPYCDVSDSVREPSPWRRMSVMLAGIYVEWIIATIATFVWIGSRNPSTAWHAFHLMLVCGISTLVFNANPLMRYDGYFVLSDLVGSVHLRSESRSAFRGIVTARIAGRGFASRVTPTIRSVLLAAYHVASTIYRCVVLFAIAAMLLIAAEYLHLESAIIVLMAVVAIALVFKQLRSMAMAMGGKGDWSGVSGIRRAMLGATALLIGIAVFLIPLPRYQTARGTLDAALADTVYLPHDALVDLVPVTWGQYVKAGETIVRLRDEANEIEMTKVAGRLSVARLRSQLSRRVTMDRGDEAGDWETFEAGRQGLQTRLASLNDRAATLELRAKVNGVVLPPKSTLSTPSQGGITTPADRRGTFASSQQAWCRISTDGLLHAVLAVDARDRNQIRLGSPVRIAVSAMPGQVFESVVESVSPIQSDSRSLIQRAGYEVLCPLERFPPTDVLSVLGAQCRATVRLPNRTMASSVWSGCKEWFGE
ncbi:Peptidase family M50 [Rubripirellula tenax]|uniref:Peptidase family M50 n=1 Tax=Rubripirellula tenax TaxID=2528015 RepID=A0A5C6F299_9BACT|nr:efflux RND transporter periplasmic adaptor subunit [Rubripirellula tenax]TWU54640.1 Peptidase family M50 [Rubripirellula tenax]